MGESGTDSAAAGGWNASEESVTLAEAVDGWTRSVHEAKNKREITKIIPGSLWSNF